MNARRWFGALLLVGALVSLSVGAYGQDKDKDKDKGKDKDKTAVKKDADKDKTKPEAPKDKGEIKLVLKAFEPKGKTFYQEMSTKTKQVMKVMQMEVTQNQDQTFWVSWTPKDKKDNDLVVEQTIVGVKMDIEIGGNKISYDSTAKDQPANPLTDFFKALKDAKFTVYINDDPKSDKYMTVTKVEGREEFIKKLSTANTQLEPLLKNILSEDALKSMAEPAFGVIPPKGEVPADKKWKKESKLDMGPIGTYDTIYNYTLKGKEGSMATIDVDTKLKYSVPKEAKKDGLPFKILKGDLESKESKGVVHFDLEKGRVNDSTMDLKIEGKLTIEIGGMTTEVDLTQTQKAELKTFDSDPTKK
jgi:Family of unknown function (DUF6263)